jgi:hypothetical protein
MASTEVLQPYTRAAAGWGWAFPKKMIVLIDPSRSAVYIIRKMREIERDSLFTLVRSCGSMEVLPMEANPHLPKMEPKIISE